MKIILSFQILINSGKNQLTNYIQQSSLINSNLFYSTFMEEKTFIHSILRSICGKKYLLMLTDAAQIMSRQEEFQNSQKYVQSFKKLSESIRNHVISGGALAIALSLSLQRYFPSKFSTFGFNKILVDLSVIAFCLFTATNMALKTNNNEMGKIKKQLMLNFDRQFLNHMADIQIKFQIDQEDQVRGLFNKQEYDQWVEKRHMYLF